MSSPSPESGDSRYAQMPRFSTYNRQRTNPTPKPRVALSNQTAQPTTSNRAPPTAHPNVQRTSTPPNFTPPTARVNVQRTAAPPPTAHPDFQRTSAPPPTVHPDVQRTSAPTPTAHSNVQSSTTGIKQIYVLQLTQGKYYVGSSTNAVNRVLSHFQGVGSGWTKLYPPVSIIRVEPFDDFKEDMITKQMMSQYGVEDVRGGQYSNIELSEEQMKEIFTSILHNQDRCLRCGREGHWINNCFATFDVGGKPIPSANTRTILPARSPKYTPSFRSHYDSSAYSYDSSSGSSDDDCCFRCGRYGHWASECYARTTVEGDYL
jgi:predicted GIY-YIG superfamily endonuclease